MKVKITGLKEARAALRDAKKRVQAATAGAIYVAGGVVMTEAKQRAPVDFGILRNSGYVTLPKAGPRPKVELGFGGAAEQYALVQHERTEFRHEVGEAKYLENALNAIDVPGIVADELQRRLPDGEGPAGGEHPLEPK